VFEVISGIEKSDSDIFEMILRHSMLNREDLVKDVIISVISGAVSLSSGFSGPC
jgi:hypothetical protein